MKKKIPYVIAFIIPIIILVTIFFSNGILTGEYTGFFSDLENQYFFLFDWFRKVLTQGNSFLYSFSKGLGGGMIGTFAYYLASPFNLLFLFFNNTRLCIFFLIILKIGLMSLTMFIYLKYHFKNKNGVLIAFSTFYALSLFTLQNYFQLMWLDGYILAPLVLLGIDKIIDSNKPLLYGVCLFLAIISNYYTGYMICLFSVIYFIYKLLLKGKKYIKNNKCIIKTFLIISILAGFMTAVLSFPTLIELLNSNRFGNDVTVHKVIVNFDVISNFQSMIAGNTQEVFNYTNAYWYCGIVILPLIYFYFVNKEISMKEKVLSGIILTMFILSIIFRPMNLIWHAFSYPIGYNYRHFFLAIIFILYLASKSLFNLKDVAKVHYYIAVLIYLTMYFAVLIFGNLSIYLLYFNLALMLLYMVILYWYSYKEIDKNQLLWIFTLLCIGEVYFHTGSFYLNYDFSNLKGYQGRLNEIAQFSKQVKEKDNSPFYRMELDDYNYGFLDAFYADYYGATTWISGIDDDIIDTLNKYGFSNTYVLHDYKHHPIFDSLFGIKYYRTLDDITYYDKIGTQSVSSLNDFLFGLSYQEVNIYQNPYALSLGYMVDSNQTIELENTIYQYQNDVFQSFTGGECVYCKLDYTKKGNEYTFTVNSENPLLLDLDNHYEEYEYKVYLSDTLIATINQDNGEDIMLQNNFKKGDEITLHIENKNGNDTIYIYEFNLENFKKGVEKLQREQLIIEDFQQDYIRGQIEVLNEGTMVLSIPYDESWTIKVDGKTVKYDRVNGIFTGVFLTSGSHEIELTYCPKGLKLGAIISGFSTITFGVYVFINRKKTIKMN